MSLVWLFVIGTGISAEESGKKIRKVPFGAEATLEGVIVERSEDVLTVRHYPEGESRVVLTPMTRIQERKKNPFRSAKEYSTAELLLGLKVEISGRGDQEGALVAEEVKFTQDDLKTAQTITSRVVPLESGLEETRMSLESTQARLSETEQRLDTTVQQMGGEIEELDSAFRTVRNEARQAQLTADQALEEVENVEERVTRLDDYEEIASVHVRFDFNSAELHAEAKEQLDETAEKYRNQKGYLLQVVGFASSDGNEEYNRRLSQQRAEAVVTYLTQLRQIPLRRIVYPHGFGERNPVADNTTLEGRRQNRRVEVKVLVNRGLAEESKTVAAAVGGESAK